MTLIIGFIHNNSSFIVVDSAATAIGDVSSYFPDADKTAFDEPIFRSDEKLVVDTAQKLYVLHHAKVLIAFAGKDVDGRKIVEDLDLFLKLHPDGRLTDKLPFFFEQNPNDNQFMAAFQEDNKAKIFVYQAADAFGILEDDQGITMVGNAAEIQDQFFARNVRYGIWDMKASGLDLAWMDVLVCVISICQVYSLNRPTLSEGVGGFYNGGYVSSERVELASDTIYIVYSAKTFLQSKVFWVSKYNRDSATVLFSSIFSGEYTVVASSHGVPDLIAWTTKWSAEVIDTFRKVKSDYYVSLCQDRLIVTIMTQRSTDKVVEVFEKKVNFSFSTFILDRMLRETEPDDLFSPPFVRVHFSK